MLGQVLVAVQGFAEVASEVFLGVAAAFNLQLDPVWGRVFVIGVAAFTLFRFWAKIQTLIGYSLIGILMLIMFGAATY